MASRRLRRARVRVARAAARLAQRHAAQRTLALHGPSTTVDTATTKRRVRRLGHDEVILTQL